MYGMFALPLSAWSALNGLSSSSGGVERLKERVGTMGWWRPEGGSDRGASIAAEEAGSGMLREGRS